MIVVEENACREPAVALGKEWLETNGSGGYASSTVLCCHTRKYHGFLVANLRAPAGRHVLLSKCEESLLIDGDEYFLSIHRYSASVAAGTEIFLRRMTVDLYPCFLFSIGDIRVSRELLLLRGEDTLLVKYRLERAPVPVLLKIRPFFAYRGIHELARENSSIHETMQNVPGGIRLSPYGGMPDFFMQTPHDLRYSAEPLWYRNFEYEEEERRGFSFREDLFTPGVFQGTLDPGEEVLLSFSTTSHAAPGKDWEGEVRRRSGERNGAGGDGTKGGEFHRLLERSAGNFLIQNRENRSTVIAGYHWFYEWGRDTLISLPGLAFSTKRIDRGIEILLNLAERRRDGLIPNTASEVQGEDAFNSVDASLWFFWCVQELLRHSGDYDLVHAALWDVLKDIIDSFIQSLPPHVTTLDNGLLAVGDMTTQLTWMDARVGEIPVTPRQGCPVEINALWFNALSLMGHLAGVFKYAADSRGFDEYAERVKGALCECFWMPDRGYMADVWDPRGKGTDPSMRPNQIFAVSLPYSALDGERQRMVVERVTAELLTPYGLRTLSPHDSRYCGFYGGSAEMRDGAYHQGTVWPWLLGHYGEALLKVSEHPDDAVLLLQPVLESLFNHLFEAGLGHISEVFSGDDPHRPGGCIAQAWSTAEVLRLLDILENRPRQS